MQNNHELSIYEQCINDLNIKNAINTFIKSKRIPTADYNEDKYIKAVKLRLRRYKRIGNKNEILFDEITFQAVYQVLSRFIKFDKNVLIDNKHLLARVCDYVDHNPSTYSIDFNLQSLLSIITVDQVLDCLRKKINDSRVIKMIKHLLWYSKKYAGTGLQLNNPLYVLIANYFLTTVDDYINERINILNDVCYYRSLDNCIVLCKLKSTQLLILSILKEYFTNYNIDDIFNLHYKKIIFLNFKIYKNEFGLNIFIADETLLHKQVKSYKWNSIQEIKQFLHWMNEVFTNYDITTKMDNFIRYLTRRMLCIAKRKHTNLSKVEKHLIFKYTFNGKEILMDPYQMRKQTRKHFRNYLK